MLGLLGILLGLALIMVLAFRSWTILLLAPLAAAVAALFSGQPMLAHWTQTFMPAAAGFVAQFFPLFLLCALFGKLIESITHPKVAVASIDVTHGKVSDICQLASILLMGNIILHHRRVYLQSSLMCLVAAALVSASDILRFWRIQFKSSDFSK